MSNYEKILDVLQKNKQLPKTKINPSIAGMTVSEISEEIGLNPGTISTATRLLQFRGDVKRVKRGSVVICFHKDSEGAKKLVEPSGGEVLF